MSTLVAPPSPAAYFARAWSHFECATGEAWQCQLGIGGQSLQVEGKGQALANALRPALRHLEQPDCGAPHALTLRTWDRAAGGIGLPPLGAQPGDTLHHGRIVRLTDDRYVVVWERHFDAVTMVDRVGGRAIYFTGDATALPYYETAAPLRALWHAWFSGQGILPLHGASVGRGGESLLLTAPGGNGKSTTALLALQAGFDYLADDWCLVAPRARAAFSLFNTAKLRPDNLHRFPGLASRIHNHDKLDDQKATFFLHRDFAAQLRSASRLRAIVVPRVSGGAATTFARESSALAWHALLGVTMQGIAGAGRETISLLGEVVRCVPVYRLNLGSDLEHIPPTLEAILAHAAQS